VNFLTLVPRWVWWVLGAVTLCLAGAWWHGHAVDKAIREAVEADRAQWQAKARDELSQVTIDVHKQQTTAALAMLEISHEDANRASVAQADAARARAGRDSLQRTIAALRGGGGAEGQSTGPIALSDAAPALASALSQCSSEYGEVAAVADQLGNQVTGLQAYIERVVAPLAIENPPAADGAMNGAIGGGESVSALDFERENAASHLMIDNM
jgi:hypothetical protein